MLNMKLGCSLALLVHQQQLQPLEKTIRADQRSLQQNCCPQQCAKKEHPRDHQITYQVQYEIQVFAATSHVADAD